MLIETHSRHTDEWSTKGIGTLFDALYLFKSDFINAVAFDGWLFLWYDYAGDGMFSVANERAEEERWTFKLTYDEAVEVVKSALNL